MCGRKHANHSFYGFKPLAKQRNQTVYVLENYHCGRVKKYYSTGLA